MERRYRELEKEHLEDVLRGVATKDFSTTEVI